MRKQQHSTSSKLLTVLFILLALPTAIFMVHQVKGAQAVASSVSYTIYEDALASGWHARSSASRINLANTSPVYSGSRSIAFTPTSKGGRLYLYTHTAVDGTLYSFLHFAAQASQAGQSYTVTLYSGSNKPLATVRLAHYGGDPIRGTWKVYNIPLPDLKANATLIKGVALQSRTRKHGTVYLDSISLTGAASSITATVTATVTATPTFTPTPVPHLVSTSGKNLYVSPSGSDSNDGSQAHSFATINKAASAASPGTIVHVAPGKYTVPVYTAESGTQTARITYISDIKWGAKIVADGAATNYGSTWVNQGDYVDIIGFDISGGESRGIRNYGSYVHILHNYVHDIKATNCSNSDGGAGIEDTNYRAHDIDIIGNVVEKVALPKPCNYVQAIYISTLRERVLNNIIIDNGGIGISCWHACNSPTIANNLVLNNGYGIQIGAGDKPGGVTTDNAIVSNNIIMNNGDNGIYETHRALVGTHNHFLNNLLYGNQYSGCRLLNGNTCVNTVTADPQFMNYQPDGSGDYHLKATSPAIDSGTSTGAPSTDIDNNPRPQGNGYDIGPYEYSSNVRSPAH